MTRTEQGVWCDNCGVEITWAPIIQVGRMRQRLLHFCCEDCLEGRGCECGLRMEQEEQTDRAPAYANELGY
jgi:hypothetical protein